MTTIPPLIVSVKPNNLTCILDLPLALSSYGLRFALRLGREFNVWLVPMLWRVIDDRDLIVNISKFLRAPTLFQSRARHDQSELDRSLDEWDWARIWDISGLQIYWPSEELREPSPRESSLPDGVDPEIVTYLEVMNEGLAIRFTEGLQQIANRALELLRKAPVVPTESTLIKIPDFQREIARAPVCLRGTDLGAGADVVDGCRQAAALCVVLEHQQPVILTLAPDTQAGENEPYICELLRVAGVSCEQLRGRAQLRAMEQYFLPAFARTGIGELLATNRGIAVLHLHAPARSMMLKRASEPPGLTSLGAEEKKSFWNGAKLVWYKLGTD